MPIVLQLKVDAQCDKLTLVLCKRSHTVDTGEISALDQSHADLTVKSPASYGHEPYIQKINVECDVDQKIERKQTDGLMQT